MVINSQSRSVWLKRREVTKASAKALRPSSWVVGWLRTFSKISCECLRQGQHRYDSLEELEARIRDRDCDLVQRHGGRALLETLFDYSVIGVRLGDAGSTRFKAESPNLTLPSAGTAYVTRASTVGWQSARSAWGPIRKTEKSGAWGKVMGRMRRDVARRRRTGTSRPTLNEVTQT